MSLTYEIGGRGKDGGNEGRMIIFSVLFKLDGKVVANPVKDDIGVHVEPPSTSTAPRFNIMVTNGSYHVGFTPSVGGQYWFDFTYKGQWANEPFCLAVKNKLNKVPDTPYTGSARGGAPVTKPAASGGAAPTTATKTAGPAAKVVVEPCPSNSSCSERTAEMTDEEEGSFKITAVSNSGETLKGDYKFDIKFDGPSDVKHSLSNNGDGTYKCTFGGMLAGEYRVEVSYKGKLIEKGSWQIRVVDAMALMAIEELTILVQATDKLGNPKTEGGEVSKFKVICTNEGEAEIEDQEDGRYTIIYPVKPGLNTIDVKYEGESLSGFPLSFEIPVE